MRHALLLIAHGSKDPTWKQPFEAMAEQLAKTHQGPVLLSYLESTTPDVAQALAQLLAQGAQQVTVAPLFLASGSHVRVDIPALVAQARRDHPQVNWQLLPAAGELPAVQRAIAAAVQDRL
jgi:sirohydrochlorin cobaltochelatase